MHFCAGWWFIDSKYHYIKHVSQAANVTTNGTSRPALAAITSYMILTTTKWLCRDAKNLMWVALRSFLYRTNTK